MAEHKKQLHDERWAFKCRLNRHQGVNTTTSMIIQGKKFHSYAVSYKGSVEKDPAKVLEYAEEAWAEYHAGTPATADSAWFNKYVVGLRNILVS